MEAESLARTTTTLTMQSEGEEVVVSASWAGKVLETSSMMLAFLCSRGT